MAQLQLHHDPVQYNRGTALLYFQQPVRVNGRDRPHRSPHQYRHRRGQIAVGHHYVGAARLQTLDHACFIHADNRWVGGRVRNGGPGEFVQLTFAPVRIKSANGQSLRLPRAFHADYPGGRHDSHQRYFLLRFSGGLIRFAVLLGFLCRCTFGCNVLPPLLAICSIAEDEDQYNRDQDDHGHCNQDAGRNQDSSEVHRCLSERLFEIQSRFGDLPRLSPQPLGQDY